jgi:hypothetical protein
MAFLMQHDNLSVGAESMRSLFVPSSLASLPCSSSNSGGILLRALKPVVLVALKLPELKSYHEKI